MKKNSGKNFLAYVVELSDAEKIEPFGSIFME